MSSNSSSLLNSPPSANFNFPLNCNMKFKTFSLVPNSKFPSNEWTKDKKTKKFINKHLWRNESISNLMLSPSCRGIPTGRINKCFVLDLDFYDKFHDDGTIKKKFNSAENEFIQTFGNVDEIIKKFSNTLITKTASGGLHLFFQYENTFKTTSNEYHQIDIRSDGGYVVAPGSVVPKGVYKVVSDKNISPIPEDLSLWLKNNLWKKKTITKPLKKNNKDEVNSISHEAYEQDEVDLSAYRYNIDESCMIEILDGLPDEYFTDNYKWLIFSTAMKQVGHKDLWEMYSEDKGGKTFNYERNESKWKYLKDKSLFCLEHILNASSAVKDAKTFLGYVKYKPTNNHNVKPHKILENRRYLDPSNDGTFLLEESLSHDCILIQSDTGTGKTTAFKNFIKKTEKPFISIVSRITLGEEQVRVMRNEGIECKFHQEITDTIKDGFMKNGEPEGDPFPKAGFYEYEGDNLVITIDSIMKIGNWGNNGDDEDSDYNPFEDYVVYLDELNSLIEYFVDCPNLHSKRLIVYQFLIKVLQGAECVIGTDADISDISLNFFSGNDLPFHYIVNEYKHNKGIEAEELFSYKSLVEEISNEDKYMVACDEKGTAIKLGDDLKRLGHKDILVVSADSPMEVLQDLDLDKHDKVIFSPKIVYGLDSVMERKVFGYFRCRTIDPRGMIQQICRCRNIISLQFLFEDKSWKPYKYDSIAECREVLMNGVNIMMKSFSMCGLEESQKIFNDLYSQYVYNQDTFKSNYFAHFLQLILSRGFEYEMNPELMNKSTGQTASIAKEIKEQKEKVVLDEFDKFYDVYKVEYEKLKKKYDDYSELIRKHEYKTSREHLNDWADEHDIKFMLGDSLAVSEGRETYEDFKERSIGYLYQHRGYLWDDVNEMSRKLVEQYFSPVFAEVIHLLHIPMEQIEECKDLITDPKLLGRYYTMKRYFFDPLHQGADPILEHIEKRLDFDIKSFSSTNNQLIFLDKLKKGVGIHERKELTMTNELSPENAEKLWIEYTSIRRVRTKKNAFLDPAGVKKQIIVLYKDLFGVEIINTKRTTKKNEKTGKLDKKTLYSINSEYYEKMYKVYHNTLENEYKPPEE
jgi:hypothetical protein